MSKKQAQLGPAPFVLYFTGDNGNVSQKHHLYFLPGGVVQDHWLNGWNNGWATQQINLGGAGVTDGPAAAEGRISAADFFNQFHIFYRGQDGGLWNPWWDGAQNHWNLQKLNQNALTSAPTAIGAPCAGVFRDQMHVFFRGADNGIWDSWYNRPTTGWTQQKLNLGGLTSAPAAAGDPYVLNFFDQQHVFFRDGHGTVWDVWYDADTCRWQSQQLNNGGLTSAPAAIGDPYAVQLREQMHVLFRTAGGTLWDSWYNRPNGGWIAQQLNHGGLTQGPPAVGDPASSVYNDAPGTDDQMHVFYVAAGGVVGDCWYNTANCLWEYQQLNLGKVTSAPAAATNLYTMIDSKLQSGGKDLTSQLVYFLVNGELTSIQYRGSNNRWLYEG